MQDPEDDEINLLPVFHDPPPVRRDIMPRRRENPPTPSHEARRKEKIARLLASDGTDTRFGGSATGLFRRPFPLLF